MNRVKLIGKQWVYVLSFLVVCSIAHGDMPNYAVAAQLATKSKSNVRQREASNAPLTQNQRNQRNRGSAIDSSANTSREAGCGGLALGNVRPILGDHRRHNVTIIVTGNIINSGNNC
jgi:hypothetical protein